MDFISSIEFKYPENYFFFALALAAAVVLFLAYRKKERIMSSLHLNLKVAFKYIRTSFIFAGLALFAFSALGPQLFEGYTTISKTGMDIYVIIDTSKSMLATDIKPDRISIAKRAVAGLIDSLDGDRVGFIPFASQAYVQMPLTDDYQLAKMFLDVIDTEMMSGGGTNIAAALKLANDSFNRSSSADRVVIILSDGEEHEAESLRVLQSINDERLRVFTIGVGTERGGLVPVYGSDGVTISDYMKDETNNPVTSRLEPALLQTLAREGNGAYYQATLQGTETDALLEDLARLKRDVFAEENIKRFSPLFQYFLGAGLLFILAGWFLPERRGLS